MIGRREVRVGIGLGVVSKEAAGKIIQTEWAVHIWSSQYQIECDDHEYYNIVRIVYAICAIALRLSKCPSFRSAFSSACKKYASDESGTCGELAMRTMRKLVRVAASIAAFVMALPNFTERANAWEPMALTNTQLDNITAGLYASAAGSGAAAGLVSSSEVSVATVVGANFGGGAAAIGHVTSSASSSTPGVSATAGATLSLRITLP